MRGPCSLALLCLMGCAADPGSPAVSPLRARLELIRAVHPAPLRTASDEELERLLLAVDSPSPTPFEAAGALRKLLARVGDSHLAGALPPPAPGEATFLPLLVLRVGEDYRVDACSDPAAVGAVLTGIGGVPMEVLMEELASMATVDGDRPAVRLAEAERRFVELLRLARGAQEVWQVQVQHDAEPATEHSLAGVGLAALAGLDAQRQSRAAGRPDASPLPQLFHDGSLTVLRLATFAPTDRAAYLAEVEALAPAMASAENLVIDLRGNEGGDRSLGVAVARHLLAAPFAQWARVRTRVRAIPERFADHVRFIAGPEEALTEFPGEATADGRVVRGDPLAATMTPLEPRYDGPLTLVVDDGTNSAAVELAVALLAHHPDVRVAGSETQGECAWHIGQLPILYDDGRGPAMLLSLFEIELVAYPDCRSGRGIEPDLPVTTTLEDFREGRDPVMAALRR